MKNRKTEKREEFKKLKKGGLKGEIWDYVLIVQFQNDTKDTKVRNK